MVGILQDKDRIFTNLYGLHDFGLEGAKQRGAWNGTKDILDCGRDWIIEQMKGSGPRKCARTGRTCWSSTPTNPNRGPARTGRSCGMTRIS
jgi:NADH-quinone oxidoreductase subunit F